MTAGTISAQPSTVPSPDPRGAFLRSMALPGWGHHYMNSSDWQRGQYHLAAEATLLLSYLGLNIYSDNLQDNWISYTRQSAGIDIEGRGRMLKLAVGDFESLEAYNDYQLRTRNWDRLIDDVPSNRWNWKNESDRFRYNTIRERFENIDQQLPALLGLMVVNRVVSAISAYNRAKSAQQETGITAFHLAPAHAMQGISAHLKISF